MKRPTRATPYAYQRGGELSLKTSTYVPADCKVRPLRDHIVVEPFEHTLSAILLIVNERRPVAGIVKAVGPGHYAKLYDHSDKHKRTKTWDSKRFTPTELKVGDEVELGAIDGQGYAFESFYWGDKLHLMCREADVAGVRIPESLDTRRTAQRA